MKRFRLLFTFNCAFFVFLLCSVVIGLPAELSAQHTTATQSVQSHQILTDKATAKEKSIDSHEASPKHHEMGNELSVFWIVPFVGILLSIALCPLFLPQFWHHHFGKVSFGWAMLLFLPLLFSEGSSMVLPHVFETYIDEYIPFMVLLTSLFVISGGILVRGKIQGTPRNNVLFILIGTLLASWLGTTGASMLLIRPMLKANKDRKNKKHMIIFFIFLVSNIGGALTPLGDPPLFLGFLKGVPFFWTFHTIYPMVCLVLLLLTIFYFWDRKLYACEKEEVEAKHRETNHQAFSIVGLLNFIYLGGVVFAVLTSGIMLQNKSHWFVNPETGLKYAIHISHLGEIYFINLYRDGIMIVMTLLSWFTTSMVIRKENDYSWFPILEVAYLFFGIFMTIIPAIAILRAGSEGALAPLISSVTKPWHYFWVTGMLSSFLDNAPTYLVFFNAGLGTHVSEYAARGFTHLLPFASIPFKYLLAISCGAVFMGANSYIGNAPNFMVKSIAEESGIEMPSFIGYLKYSFGILIPCFVLVTFLFFL